MNWNNYKITEDNVSDVVDIEAGFILNPFIGYGGWSTVNEIREFITNNSNKIKFYRKKMNIKTKTLHTTYELVIVDKDEFKHELENRENAEIHQFIEDNHIVTALQYSEKESNKEYLSRTITELKRSIAYYSTPFQKTRFCFSKTDSDHEKEEFTKLVLQNAKIVLSHLLIQGHYHE